jgi:hypothetical protein
MRVALRIKRTTDRDLIMSGVEQQEIEADTAAGLEMANVLLGVAMTILTRYMSPDVAQAIATQLIEDVIGQHKVKASLRH